MGVCFIGFVSRGRRHEIETHSCTSNTCEASHHQNPASEVPFGIRCVDARAMEHDSSAWAFC